MSEEVKDWKVGQRYRGTFEVIEIDDEWVSFDRIDGEKYVLVGRRYTQKEMWDWARRERVDISVDSYGVLWVARSPLVFPCRAKTRVGALRKLRRALEKACGK